MRWGKGKKPTSPFPGAKITEPYLPRALKEIDAKRITQGHQIIQDAAIDYFNRLNAASTSIPAADAAILIKLHHHIGAELARNDPVAAELAKALDPIEFPPIHYTKNN